MNYRKHPGKSMLKYWAVLWLVLSSGSLYFQYQRMALTVFILAVTIVLMLVKYKNIMQGNIYRMLIILGIIFLNFIINCRNGIRINDLIILFVELTFLVLLQSNMSFDEFKKKYVQIMIMEALISLFCYLWADILRMPLPFQHWEIGNLNDFNLTPYYTIGWGNAPVLGRNAGIFHEPGAHQIFLNFALFFLISDKGTLGVRRKKTILYCIVLIMTVLSTKSATGYICLIIVFGSLQFLESERSLSQRKNLDKIKNISILFFILACLIESVTNIVSHKLSGNGSFATRYNDTFGGLKIALTRPLTGYGIYRKNASKLLLTYGISNISNGLISLTIGLGIPAAVLYLTGALAGLKRNFKGRDKFYICVFIFFFLCINTEGGSLNPIYMMLLLKWNNCNKETLIKNSK